MNPSVRTLVSHALALSAAAASSEVAARASSTAGLSVLDLAALVGVAFALTAACVTPVAAVLARIAPSRAYGLVWGGLVGLHVAINYRFEVVLNEFVRDPKVFVGVPLAFVAGVVPLVLADRLVRKVPSWALLGVGLAALGVAAVRIQPPARAPGTAPNVVIISLDTLRMDRTGPYGHTVQTPVLDRIAREGVVFEQAIAEAPITEPSHLAMLTGIAPYKSGIVTNGTVLGDRPALLWRVLADEGYATAGFVSGFPLHGKYGWGQGIDVWDDDFGSVAGVQSLSIVKAWNQVAIREHALRERTADLVLARAIPWIEANAGTPRFAFVHFYDVHGPYDTHGALGPPPTEGEPLELPFYWPAQDRRVTDARWLELAYDKEVEFVDRAVGQVVSALGDELDNTLLIITADHGESFTEHGYLFDHGDNLYDPSLRVPLIVRYPKAAKAGTRVACQVGGVDVVPTVMDVLGVTDGISRDGRSLKEAMGGGACESTAVYSSTVAGRMVAEPPVAHSRRMPTEKVVFYSDKNPEYFDLASDPGETMSLDNGSSRDALDQLVRALQTGGTLQSAAQDSQTMQMLQSLGYIEPGE